MYYEKKNYDYDRESHESMGKDGDDRASKKFGAAVYHRKKICKFCSDTEFHLDYKDARIMQSFLTEHGKIVPRRISGNCAKHQRKLTIAVKRARILALVGYTSVGN